MAIKKIKGANTDTPANYGEWLIDNDSDISSLPTSKDKKDTDDIASIGSLAYSIESNKIYMLNNSDSWGDATKLLKGTDLEDIKKEVAKQIAAVVADAPEQFDTLKEIADWIEGHNISVDGINAKIEANENAIKQNTEDIKSSKKAIDKNTAGIETNKLNIEKNAKDISNKQSKLTAGKNITISDDNTISAKEYDDTTLKTEVDKKQNKLVAGSNITIDENTNTISSKDTVYDDTEIKKNKQDKLIAGENITILSDGKTLNAVNTKYTLNSDGTTITLTGTDGSEQSISDNHVTVDSSLSSTSTNPVQNKVINSALSGKQDKGNYATKTEVTTEVNTQIAKVVANAPEDFDTLKEISDWIDKHEDSAAAMNTAISKKQDKLTAGSNITIDENTNTISSKDTVYDDTEIKKNKQDKLIAGENITILSDGKTLNAVNTKYTLNSDGTTITLTGTDGSEQSISDNHVTVDSALSSTSINPIQNKIINAALGEKQGKGNYRTYGMQVHHLFDDTKAAKIGVWESPSPGEFVILEYSGDYILPSIRHQRFQIGCNDKGSYYIDAIDLVPMELLAYRYSKTTLSDFPISKIKFFTAENGNLEMYSPTDKSLNGTFSLIDAGTTSRGEADKATGIWKFLDEKVSNYPTQGEVKPTILYTPTHTSVLQAAELAPLLSLTTGNEEKPGIYEFASFTAGVEYDQYPTEIKICGRWFILNITLFPAGDKDSFDFKKIIAEKVGETDIALYKEQDKYNPKIMRLFIKLPEFVRACVYKAANYASSYKLEVESSYTKSSTSGLTEIQIKDASALWGGLIQDVGTADNLQTHVLVSSGDGKSIRYRSMSANQGSASTPVYVADGNFAKCDTSKMSVGSAANDSEGNNIAETYAKVVEGAITAGTNASYVKLKLKKISNIVYLYGSFTIKSLSTNNVATNVFTIPDGFQAAYAKSAITYITGLNTPMFLQGLQDGKVTISMEGLETGTSYAISASWIAQDPNFN